jgi:adenylosuccinate synthase
LLDEDIGRPRKHTTWSKTTFHNVPLLLGNRHFERVGVTRAYGTRHGNGSLPNQDPYLTQHVLAAGEHNKRGPWQGSFRCGWMCLGDLRYVGYVLGHLDLAVIRCVDHLGDYWPMSDGHGLHPYAREDAIREIEGALRARDIAIGVGPTHLDTRAGAVV